MPTIAEVRKQYPQYDDMGDDALASALHRKYYSDMPRREFDAKIGLSDVAARTDEEQGPQAPHPAVRPFASYGGNYDKHRREAQDLMASGLEDLRAPTGGDLLGSVGAAAKGVGKLAAGGIGYLASPLNAAYDSFGATPLEDVAGVPKEVSMPLMGLATPIPSRIPMPRMPRAAVQAEAPTAESLVNSYKAAKESPEVAAVQIKPEAAGRNADVTKAALDTEWLDPMLAPKTHYILDKLQSAPEGASVTMANVDSARRLLGRLAGRGDEEAAAAQIAKRKLDDWMGSMSQTDAIAGNVPRAQEIMQAGRGDYAGAKLSEALDDKLASAELRASGTYSGLNLQNAIKQKVTSFLESDASRGLTPSQRAAGEAVVQGTLPENGMRWMAHVMGGGGGMGAVGAGGVGAAAVGPVGAAAPFVGFGLNRLGAAITSRNAQRVSELIRSETPLGRQLRGPVEDFSKAAQAAEVSPTARNLSRLTIATRNLSTNLKDANINVSPNEILKSLFGQQKAAADNDE